MDHQFDVLVIGAGAAGMFGAITAARQGKTVLLLEANDRPGKKLAITGKGRCNVTNRCTPEQVLANIPRNSRFLTGALHRFTPEDTVAFFEQNGCPLKTERGNRVFPVSDSARDVVDVLRRALERERVTQVRGRAAHITVENGAVCGVMTQDGRHFAAKSVLLCTGGKSYPATGSTGDGYRMARQLGHSIVPPRGSLVPLEEAGDFCARMQGLTLKNVAIALKDEAGGCCYRDFGELLFTHFGLSGPIVLSASAHMEPQKHYTIHIDLKPALDEQTLDGRLVREFQQMSNRNFANALSGLFPAKLIPLMVERSGIPPEQKVHSITRQQRRRLLELTKDFSVSIRGTRPASEAIITAGGVDVRQVDPKTMESRLVQGLYFAGEILDCDAYTGGFNLQIAWSSAYVAGMSAGQEKI